MSRPSRPGVTLRTRKHSQCRKCGKRILRTHTFFASSFDIAHTMRSAWMRVTHETCQECRI